MMESGWVGDDDRRGGCEGPWQLVVSANPLMRPSPTPHARKLLRLLALGGATLVDSGGAVVAEQRRRLALLILVAAGRLKGVSRDKLFSYLNPESSTESARHALHQLLYYIRQQAGDDVLRFA